MDLTEEKAKELLDFLARKAGYRCCKLMKNPETGMFELVFSNEKLLRGNSAVVCIYKSKKTIWCKRLSFKHKKHSDAMKMMLEAASCGYEVFVATSIRTYDLEKEEKNAKGLISVIMHPGKSLEEMLVEKDLGSYA